MKDSLIFRAAILMATLTPAWVFGQAGTARQSQTKEYPAVVKWRPGSLAPSTISGQKYKHKSEAEIARMTAAQGVDEWVNEQVHHRYDLSDDHDVIIKKYVLLEGRKALPRIVEIMDEYDPTRYREGKGRRGERYDACCLMLHYIDRGAVRLRGSEEGRRAMDALESAIRRMRAAGYGQEDQDEWEKHGRFETAVDYLRHAKGIGFVDDDIRDTLWVRYKIQMSEEELLAFSNFLIAHDPTYPSWSETDLISDHTRLNEAGNPLRVYILKKPEPFYQAYQEFKRKTVSERR